MERQQQEMRAEMEEAHMEIANQRQQMEQDRENAEDYARYH